VTELKITEAVIFDYGASLGVRLSDGRAIRFTAQSLVEQAPTNAAYQLEKVRRDRDTLLRQLATATEGVRE
jgi:hypothetical protein